MIVVIGILIVGLKSCNAEADRRPSSLDIAKENGGEGWESRVACARNMPGPPVTWSTLLIL
jgi:hypothetical protein